MDLVPLLADSSSNLLAARNQMAFTLGFHIILACMGVAFPAIMLIAEYRGRKHGDAEALKLAERWSRGVAVLFAVGAVTGTVLSFEMGLLWPEFMDRFGDAFGIAFAIEGLFFFTEAIFIAIYIYGWKRLPGWAHFWSGVPIVIAGLGGAASVVAANSWMNQPAGFTLGEDGRVSDVEPWDVLFNAAAGYEIPHMILAAYMVAGFLVASVYAVGMLRGRRDRYHRVGFLIPVHRGCDRHADSALRRRHRGSRDRRRPARQVRRDGVRVRNRARSDRVHRRHLHRRRGQVRDRAAGSRLLPGRLQHRHGGDRPRPDPRRRGAAGADAAAHRLRRHGRDRDRVDAVGAVVRRRLVAQAGPAADAVVPARVGAGRGGGGRSPSSPAGS